MCAPSADKNLPGYALASPRDRRRNFSLPKDPLLGYAKRLPTRESALPDAIDLLKIRRSVKPREMSGPGPSPAELETILTIGARVPDHGKLTPWRFIVFEGDARVRAGEVIAKVFAQKNPNATSAEIEDREAAAHRRAAGDRRRQFYQAASQGAGLGTGIVGGRQRHELGHRGDRARLRRLLADGVVRLRSRRCWHGSGIPGGRKARRFCSYRHADEAERGPPATCALPIS